ncbi:MAG: hypothetical protein M3P94_05635, partial [Chloroflexota bacterium]|nr:hypothetical protein [Chloroflexota bacterium]
MRVHCCLIRTRRSACVVDLVGRGAWVNERPIPGALALHDGDALTVGSARFVCRIEPVGMARDGTPPM